MENSLFSRFMDFITERFYFPDIRVADVVEIIILAFLIYQILRWIMNTKAWMLLKGIIVLGVLLLFAYLFKMYTILWIAQNMLPVFAVGVVVVFQPELRRALERLGERGFLTEALLPDMMGAREQSKFSRQTIDGIVEASFAMGAVKTGALIVVEHLTHLREYENTGIRMDCILSRQILINIFEHNTPLHDGAIIVRGDRIVSATCYLPLSDSRTISKDLGTRHRAAVGMSEVSDALVIAVSEETGDVSIAQGGVLTRKVTPEQLRAALEVIGGKGTEVHKGTHFLKGLFKHERSDN